MRIMLTGASGFLGRRISLHLCAQDRFDLTSAVRYEAAQVIGRKIAVGEIDGTTKWLDALSGQQVVIHAAARAHIMKDEMAEPLSEYRRVNVEGTLNLARQAVEAGVNRFIFISSIKVNGEQTPLGVPFTADDLPAPVDPYGISKWEAEKGLQELAAKSGMEVVIIRPPLVYGPEVKGNFASLIRLLQQGLPLPLGAIGNQRSLVGLDNLVDLIITCIDHRAAANQVFLAGDGEDLSTTELLRALAKAMGRAPYLVPVPAGLLMLSATLIGKRVFAKRLLGSLQVDITKTRDVLEWRPPVSVEEGLRRCFLK